MGCILFQERQNLFEVLLFIYQLHNNREIGIAADKCADSTADPAHLAGIAFNTLDNSTAGKAQRACFTQNCFIKRNILKENILACINL